MMSKKSFGKIKTMCGRVHRLRILQNRLANPATIDGYKKEEDRLIARLRKLGVKEDEIEAKALQKVEIVPLPEPEEPDKEKAEDKVEEEGDGIKR